MTATTSLETPLTAAELKELKNLLADLANGKLRGIVNLLRLQELQTQFKNAGAAVSAVEDLQVLRQILDTAAGNCPSGTPQQR